MQRGCWQSSKEDTQGSAGLEVEMKTEQDHHWEHYSWAAGSSSVHFQALAQGCLPLPAGVTKTDSQSCFVAAKRDHWNILASKGSGCKRGGFQSVERWT